MLYKFGKAVSPLRSFCIKESESSINLFYTSTKTNILWSQVPLSLQDSLIIPLSITP